MADMKGRKWSAADDQALGQYLNRMDAEKEPAAIDGTASPTEGLFVKIALEDFNTFLACNHGLAAEASAAREEVRAAKIDLRALKIIAIAYAVVALLAVLFAVGAASRARRRQEPYKFPGNPAGIKGAHALVR